MASEWQLAKIGDIAERVAMGPFGSSIKVETFVPSGVPVISGQHLRGTKVDDKVGFNFISEEHAQRLRNANVRRGDVIFTHAGNIGQVAFVPGSSQFERYVVSQRQFYMRCNHENVLPEFIVAYFKTPKGQHSLLANTSQVGVPSIAQPVTYLRTIEIPLPPLSEQRAIAHILGTLDDKIELNRRMSETLEAMARALFKSWFVDFDPVRAKHALSKVEGMDGRWQRGQSLPGLPAHLYDLFPDRLVDSELGEIPEGWEVGCLGDVANHSRRSIQPDDIENGTPYIALEHMPKGRIALTEWSTADALESNKYLFKRGEILFGKLRPYFHKVGVAPVDGVCSTDIVVLTATSSDWFGFVLGHVSSSEFVEYTNAGSTGTKMPRTSWNDMARYEFVLPPKPVANAFTELMQSSVDRITAGIHQSHTLAALRDTLLPKLISGEIRVHQAESHIDGALG